MDKDDCNNNYKYILIDRSDPNLMWNCAVSIIVFIILLFFIFMNWKPLCAENTIFHQMSSIVDPESIYSSLTDSKRSI
jgi:uncharacterized integral membrane protein